MSSVAATCTETAIQKVRRGEGAWNSQCPMIEMLTHHPAACLIAFLSVVLLMFVANRLGLISWLASLVRNEEDNQEEKRDSEDTDEYWSIHR
jgi:hypothetical protein